MRLLTPDCYQEPIFPMSPGGCRSRQSAPSPLVGEGGGEGVESGSEVY
jgi:hypothetical protein